MNYEKRCDNCVFKYIESCEEPDYFCMFCMFGFDYCKLTEFEKKKLERLERQIEHVRDELYIEECNETLTKEKGKALLKNRHAICKELNEYLKTLKKKGKIFYE